MQEKTMLLTNANLYAPEPLGPGSVLVEGNEITGVFRIAEEMPDAEVVDLGGMSLGPGFIDLHTHGAGGVDAMDGGDAIARMARFFARHGVTSFTPATVTAPFEAVGRAVEGVRRAMANPADGARALGVHLEGPFINPERAGAQAVEYCLPASPENVERLLNVGGEMARIVSLAPEVEGAVDAIRTLVGRGIVVAVGHTEATSEQAEIAFTAGARQVTHLFNAMSMMHHRRPGVAGTALTRKGVMVEIVADGVHLAPITIRLVVAAKGIDEVLLVTDSMSATGCEDGKYRLGSLQVYVHNGEARLGSGILAGSTLTLERAVVNVARWTDAGLGGAWRMVSLNPARQLGLADRLGRIAPGYQADLVAIDARGRVALTMVGGQIVYQR
jgi:N-acetylglucosamine-6-phosphate deacetylase